MHGFERRFRRLLEDWMCCTTHWMFRSSVSRWCHKIRKFAAEIFQNVKKLTAELCQILHMVTMEIVINSIRVMGIRVTISCRLSIAFEAMLLFLFFLSFFWAPRPEHRAFEGCIVWTSISLPFIGRFRHGFSLFSQGLLFQIHYMVLVFVAMWRHKFREFTAEIFQNAKNLLWTCAKYFVWLHCALASGAMYCNRSCLWVCLWRCLCVCVFMCLLVCYHDNSKLSASILTELGL